MVGLGARLDHDVEVAVMVVVGRYDELDADMVTFDVFLDTDLDTDPEVNDPDLVLEHQVRARV